MNSVGFKKEMSNVLKGNCSFCKKDVSEKDFSDRLSLKEFKISGLCQECQNKVFKE
jgi:hypothetical protein